MNPYILTMGDGTFYTELDMEAINSNNFQCIKEKNTVTEALWEFKCLFYAIPSIILYFMVYFAMHFRRTNFSSTFVHLFSLSCIYNVFCWLGDFTFTTLFGYSPICEPLVSLNHTYYLSVPYFLYNYFPVASFICSTAIAFHQLTAVFNPLRVENIWFRLRYVATGVSLVIPALLAIHIILGYMMIVPLPSGAIYIKVEHFTRNIDFMTAPLMNSIAGAVSFVLIAVCTLASVVKILIMRMNQDNRIQMRVFLVACWMCCSSLLFAVYQMLLYYSRFIIVDDFAISRVVYYRSILADVCFLPLPWVVILVNQKVRRGLLDWHSPKTSTSAVSVVTRYPRSSTLATFP